MKNLTNWNYGQRTTKTGMLMIVAVLFLIAAGCGQGTDIPGSPDWENERDWKEGQGELSDKIGDEPDRAVTDEPVQPAHNNSEDVWEQSEYAAPTGKWFFHEGEGLLGYGLTSGTQKAGAEFIVALIAHKENGEPMAHDVRIQLTERDGYEKKEQILEEIVHVETVRGDERIYSGFLPERENVSYMLSAEILNEEGEVEDTRVSTIYVPAQEINATLSMDQDVYTPADSEAILILENDGPTILFFGTYYTIEKKVNGTWRVVPLEKAFDDIGLFLPIGEKYEQKIDINKLKEGEYRVIKEIGAEGLDLTAVLATEFTIE